MGTCWSNLQWLNIFSNDGLERTPYLSWPRSWRDLVMVQCVYGKITALNAHQTSLDVVCHICFHPWPVETCSSQGQGLVDSCMAYVEIVHDRVCRIVEWWLIHLSWVDHPQLRACHRNPSSFWWFWGYLCICWANHSVSICVLLTRWDLTVFMLQSLSGGSLWRLKRIWHQLRG